MRPKPLLQFICAPLLALTCWVAAQAPPQQSASPPLRADILRGEYGPWRANNDLLSYDLDIRVDPEKKFISGKNSIRFKMLKDDTRIQLDLFANLNVDRILLGRTELKYIRELGTVFVDFPATLQKDSVQTIEFYYSGSPKETGRFGGIGFRQDPVGRHWITTACEGIGASIWWPNKDQQRDEVENMRLRVAVPSTLTDVSNGRLVGKTDLGDGYTRYDWAIHYPINNYCVSLNIGHYEHFSDKLGDLTMDFYCLPENLEKAKRQFVQAKPMLEAFQKYFGDYPFKEDGYKLIEVPYSGMEHQSAVTYGNQFANGYLNRDWTGVGVSLKFDFIIIHESAHEWFGNSITASDVSDQWIHEGWATYAECVYVEALFGQQDALRYVNGYKAKVKNQQPIITAHQVNGRPPSDQYFKGALFLNTLRSVIDNDPRWWKLLRDYCQRFKYRNIMTEELLQFFNAQTGMNLTPIFDQYLRQTALPALELRFQESDDSVSYRWKADVKDFAMPVKVGRSAQWQLIHPTTEWKTMKSGVKKEDFEVATDLYYIDVIKN
ncbi:MAG TPA: M1 family metallopeptidase [Pyrinomonadaceae bacterium]|nr:M1 family metallopeptidase [Pyrinomonadaceae bacterium]